MKINISADIREGYENVLQKGDILNLDWLVPDDSADEILSNDIISKIPIDNLENVLTGWFKKLKLGGIVKLGFIDANTLLLCYSKGQLTIQEINNIVYNNKSLIEKVQIANFIQSINMKLISARFDGINVFICAEKI